MTAWMDFNANGILENGGGERLFSKQYATGGVKTESFAVPSNHARGGYLRMRISSRQNAVAHPVGLAYDGEVEDYFGFGGASGGADFGDAPDTTIQRPSAFPGGYQTRLIDDGAAHLFATDTRLGETLTDGETGLPSLYANEDDRNVRDDEDGIRFESGWSLLARAGDPENPDQSFNVYGLTRGEAASVRPLATKTGFFSGWIDWNRDGDWDDAGEHVFEGEMIDSGPDYTLLDMQVPDDADLGMTYARFRYSQVDDEMPPNGLVFTGEVEDYLIGITEPLLVDYGDAPEPYPTRNRDGGARHVQHAEGTLHLGPALDFEADGQPEADALGDDTDADGADEGGISFPATLTVGATAELEVVVTADANRTGLLNAWIDYNQDGDWNDDGEHVIEDEELGAGTHTLSVDVPDAAVEGTTYARFRISETEGLGPDHDPSIDSALDLPNGEVEDYAVTVSAESGVSVENGEDVPKAFRLYPNYPNPFNPSTEIRFALPEAAEVSLVVYDLLGRVVGEVGQGALPAGTHRVTWKAADAPSGLYFYRLTAIGATKTYTETRRMVLAK